MLDRVGTWAFSQSLLNEYSRIQTRTQITQQQIATGKVGDHFADVKDKAGVLASAKIKAAGIDAFADATKEVMSRLSLQDLHLRQLSDLTARLRTAIGDALSTGHAPALMEDVKNLFDEAVAIFNAKLDGKYLYAGSRMDTAPVNVTTLAALVAAPTAGAVFENTQLKQAQRVDEDQVIETGVLASEAGGALMQMFKDIAGFDAGVNGPFGMDLTSAQTSFLSTQHVAVPAVQDSVNVVAAINGSRFGQAEEALERHDAMGAYFGKFIGDIEDVDLAEAVTRLNQDQVAAQAAGRMIAEINQMTLLDVMPL